MKQPIAGTVFQLGFYITVVMGSGALMSLIDAILFETSVTKFVQL